MTERLQKLRMQVKKNLGFRGTLLALDPGETTGWAVMECGEFGVELKGQGQDNTWPIENTVKSVKGLIDFFAPDFVVYEAYHVYSWRLNEHSFSEVPTIQIIGCIRTLAVLSGVGSDCQTAQTGKAFFTDKRLEAMGLLFEGQKHARDALRHACQFITFGIKEPQK